MPRRPEQFEEIREKSREKILSAALDLFANKGYDSTSIDSIAKKAGISKGLIYNYYESKQSILLAIFEDVMNEGEKMVSKQKQIKDPYVRIRGMIDMVFDMMDKSPEYLKLLMVLSLQPGVMEDTKDFTGKMFKRNSEMVLSIYSRGNKKDDIKGLMLDALIDGILLNHVRYGKKYPVKELKEWMIREYCTPPKQTKAAVKRQKKK
jgi:AcrR family transcriptional regulator